MQKPRKGLEPCGAFVWAPTLRFPFVREMPNKITVSHAEPSWVSHHPAKARAFLLPAEGC
jgi:hypothetical protein